MRSGCTTLIEYVSVSELLPELAVILNVKSPVPVGVPERTPLDGFSDNPAGSEPEETLHVGVEVPAAWNCIVYGVLTCPGVRTD
jgi:hypothetical protein